jgi:hypothetical protein
MYLGGPSSKWRRVDRLALYMFLDLPTYAMYALLPSFYRRSEEERRAKKGDEARQ